MSDIEKFTNTIYFSDYKNQYTGRYFNYYQIHIFDTSKIVSAYFSPNNYSIEQVKAEAETLHAKIREKSVRGDRITLFNKASKFLICEDVKFIEPGDILEFNSVLNKYDYFPNDTDDLFDFIGDRNVEIFVKSAFITVGAEDLYSLVEVYVKALGRNQLRINGVYDKWRELNKTNPLLKLEIYEIDKNYSPNRIHEFLCHDYNSALLLPEHESILNSGQRITFLLREIISNKIIEGSLSEFIEDLKFKKKLKKNPPLMNLDDVQRMEFGEE